MEQSVNNHNRLKYFVTNKMFLLQFMYRYICMIFIVKCVTITRFFIGYAALWWKSMIFIVLSSLETVHDTVQYRHCLFSLLYRLLRIRLKYQNPVLSYVREGERNYIVNVQCSVEYTVNVQRSVQYTSFLFNVDNVLLCVIYKLNFTEFTHVTRISLCMTLYSVIQKDWLNFVRLYSLNCTWYVNNLNNIWKRKSYIFKYHR